MDRARFFIESEFFKAQITEDLDGFFNINTMVNAGGAIPFILKGYRSITEISEDCVRGCGMSQRTHQKFFVDFSDLTHDRFNNIIRDKVCIQGRIQCSIMQSGEICGADRVYEQIRTGMYSSIIVP